MLTSGIQLLSTAARTATMTAESTFMYFGYGSNLLRERIRIRNPSAVFKSIAKLQDYKLEFRYKSPRWFGASATVSASPGDHLWGVVWEVKMTDRPSLDEQEGVSYGVYKPIEVQVETPSGEHLTCRSYQLLILNAKDPRPSPHYLDVIKRGAQQNGLPADYLKFLDSIDTNGYQGEVKVYNDILAMLREQGEEGS